jgi:hypothetical protein
MILCLVTVLALSLMGFGFAKWTDGVNLGAKVATGNVGVAIQGISVNDQGADPQYCLGNNNEGKDVANIKFKKVDNKNLNVTISNAYPWYQPGFTFRVKGTGTVPVKVEKISVNNVSDPKGLQNYIQLLNWSIHVVNPASNGLAAEDRTIDSGQNTTWLALQDALKYIQIHRNGYIDVTVNAGILEQKAPCDNNLAPQDATISGNVAIGVAQWNEVNQPQ